MTDLKFTTAGDYMMPKKINERIQQLAIEAGLYVDLKGEPWPRNMNGEDIEAAYTKFAELIVQDCAALVDTLYEAYGAPSTAGKFIKEQFGVEP